MESQEEEAAGHHDANLARQIALLGTVWRNHDSTLVAHVSRASLDPGSDGHAVAAASAFSGPELLEVRNLRRRVRAGRMLYASELALLRRYVEAKREELGEESAA